MKKWLAILVGLIAGTSLVFQGWQLHRFMNVGPRFTASDGQELCERVRALEQTSYGFKDAGLSQLSCKYGSKQ